MYIIGHMKYACKLFGNICTGYFRDDYCSYMLISSLIGMVNRLSLYLRAESECFQKSVQAMCYLKMPLCGPPDPLGNPSALRLCQDECQALFFVCQQEFAGK